MVYELKIEYDNKTELDSLIQKSYFDNNNMGKLSKGETLKINKENPFFIAFKDKNNTIVKLSNSEIMQGFIRLMVEEKENHIELIPCSIYCIIEDEKYSFY